ncbi:MAG: T9SS type A sorting domain-containing protein [Ignavibacteriaceae bacterium]|nr:T9SS type A sorting domain-containing protein [Ignavibacteriaceae bacterium]
MKTNTLPMLIVLLISLALNINAQVMNGMLADGLLGQTDYITATSGLTDAKFNGPSSIAIDPLTRKVFIADRANNRVLRFASANAYITGASAEAVLGQVDFTTSTSGLAQNKFNTPIGIFVDANGTLWASDFSNNRVLKFNNASTLANGANADAVLGQPDFVTNTTAATADKMSGPVAVFLDSGGRLWVALFNQHRVLRFDNAASKPNGAPADIVLGQADFTTVTSGLTSSKMNNPNSVFVDNQGRLWVSEFTNRRVIRFDNAAMITNGTAANGVLGQPNFTTNTAVLSAAGSNGTRFVWGDNSGNIYVPHESYNRVVVFLNAAAKADGADADFVLGQPDFTTSTALNPPTQASLRTPRGLYFDNDSSHLWVGDWANNRVLRYRMNSIVPVELASFTANVVNNRIVLKWETASEVNNRSFEVEKNVNESGFVTIGSVSGNGTTTGRINYTFTDNTLNSGVVKYRLKQIDFSGAYEYSGIIVLNNSEVVNDFALLGNYPNPFNPSTNISFYTPTEEHVSIDIYNSIGESVKSVFNGISKSGINTVVWNGTDHSAKHAGSGIYFYVVRMGSKMLTSKMVLQQ